MDEDQVFREIRRLADSTERISDTHIEALISLSKQTVALEHNGINTAKQIQHLYEQNEEHCELLHNEEKGLIIKVNFCHKYTVATIEDNKRLRWWLFTTAGALIIGVVLAILNKYLK